MYLHRYGRCPRLPERVLKAILTNCCRQRALDRSIICLPRLGLISWIESRTSPIWLWIDAGGNVECIVNCLMHPMLALTRIHLYHHYGRCCSIYNPCGNLSNQYHKYSILKININLCSNTNIKKIISESENSNPMHWKCILTYFLG